MPQDATAPSDGELVRRFAEAGSQLAFAELVSRHWPLVFQVGRRVTRNHTDAEDICQATFLALFDAARAGRHREITNVIGWLHRVATHLACHRRDANRARERHENEAAAERERTGHADWNERTDLVMPAIDQALERLPERYRVALVRHYLRGESIAEIAAACATTDGTVASWLSRGRKLLQDRLPAGGVASVALLTLEAHARQPVEQPSAAAQRAACGEHATPAVQALASQARLAHQGALGHAVVMAGLGLVAALALAGWSSYRLVGSSRGAEVHVAAALRAPHSAPERLSLPVTSIMVSGTLDPEHAAEFQPIIARLPALTLCRVPAECAAEEPRFLDLSLEDARTHSGFDAYQLETSGFLRGFIVGHADLTGLAAGDDAMLVVTRTLGAGTDLEIRSITRHGRAIDIELTFGRAEPGSMMSGKSMHLSAIAVWLGRLDAALWSVSVVAHDADAPDRDAEAASLQLEVPAAPQRPIVATTRWHDVPAMPSRAPGAPSATEAWVGGAAGRLFGADARRCVPGLAAAGASSPSIRNFLSRVSDASLGALIPDPRPPGQGPGDTVVEVTGSLESCATLLRTPGPVRWDGPAIVTIPLEEWTDPAATMPEHRDVLLLDLPSTVRPLHIRLSITHLRRLTRSLDFVRWTGTSPPPITSLDLP